MKAQEMEWKLKSKQDFYVYLDKHLQYFLPPQGHVNKDFLKQVFSGEKMLLKKKAVETAPAKMLLQSGKLADLEEYSDVVFTQAPP